jgi:predicted acyltransferase
MQQATASSTDSPAPARIVSLDQFRGYTVLGMFVVNFIGFFTVVPAILKHHNTYCSYADTIMPQFFFAVGFAYRLTYLRRAASAPGRGVRSRFWQRNARLILFGATLYLAGAAVEAWSRSHPPSVTSFLASAWRQHLFQTLVHIGVTALWILPVIGAGAGIRLAFAAGSAALHVGLSHWFYYDWVNAVHGIDGGPLGFLTWTIPMIVGSLAHDILARNPDARAAVKPLWLWGVAAMAVGYGLSCLNLVTAPNSPAAVGPVAWLVQPPFVPPTFPVNLWTMSQRAGSVSYLMFGAGFSLALYALFVWACEVRRWQLGMWRTLGTNALAGYLIQAALGSLMEPFIPRHASLWLALGELVVFVAICYGCVWLLEKKNIYWRM